MDSRPEFEKHQSKTCRATGADLDTVLVLQLPLPATKERGEGRGEGHFSKSTEGNPASSGFDS